MEPAASTDPYAAALRCLAVCARLRGVAADPEQLLHANPPASGAEEDLLRAALRLGFKARLLTCSIERLSGLPLPVPARERGGGWCVIAGADRDRILVWTPDRGTQILNEAEFSARWSGCVLLLRHEGSAGGPEKFGWSWFLPALARHRGPLAEVLLASLFVQLLALLAPLFFQVVIDKVLVHNGLTTLDVLAAGLLLVSVFEVALTWLRNYLLSHTSTRIDVGLGAELFARMLALPACWFGARRVGDVIARARELEPVRAFLTGPALTVMLDVPFAAAFLVLLYLYSHTLFLVVAGFIPAYVLLALVLTPALRRRMALKGERAAAMQSFLVEAVSAIETLKSCAAEPRQRRQWEDLIAAHARSAWDAALLGNVAAQGAALLGKLSQVLILWLGARLVLEGELSVGQLVAFNLIAGRVNGPVLRLVHVWQELQQVFVALERLRDLFEAPPEPALWTAGHVPPPRVRGRVTFEEVSFRYVPDGVEVLRDLSLDLAPGTIVGIVGPSGSGKSTLARILQRMAVPQRGRVMLDGVDLSLLDPAWLRRRVAVVQQEARLLHRSVRDNIALGEPGVDMERVVRAATLAGAQEFIARLPRGYDTVLGEGGCALSGGQRQRIALARALITGPGVLILDEATSALDFESEQAIQQNMRAMCRGRTVIIIAHRLSALQCVSWILVLENGRITEQGAPADLCRGNGYLARLVGAQSLYS